MVDIRHQEEDTQCSFTSCYIQQFYVLFKNEDGWCQQKRKPVKEFKNWPIFKFLYFNLSAFQREAAITSKSTYFWLVAKLYRGHLPYAGHLGPSPEVGMDKVKSSSVW